MHRRELTALSTAARTRVHISLRLAARRASDTKDSKPHGRQLACPALLRTVRNGDAMEAARDEVITAYRIQEFNLRARAERERRPRVAPTMCKTARTPWVTASVPGTSVNGTIHASWSFCSYHRRPADGRTAWHAARRAARSGSSMVHALSSQVLSSATSSWASSVHCACLRRPPSSDGRSDLCGNQNFTARSC